MYRTISKVGVAILCVLSLSIFGCGGGGGGGSSDNSVPPASETTPPGGGISASSKASYIVLAWNDLGMHCLNPSYDTAVILPPYNNLRAQVIKRGNKPSLVEKDITVSYRIINNSTSQKRQFGQFWTYALKLFGTVPVVDKGLNLDDPAVSNGLAGNMLAKSGYFIASGIPVTPVDDDGRWNPYQLAEITVRNNADGTILAQTRTTIPTSDEINCGKCHAQGGTLTQIFEDILVKHDQKHGTKLMDEKPVLCASCHGTPALNAPLQDGIPYLSQAIHNSHAQRGTSCYDCHPGTNTQCNRSIKHTTADGGCTNCHGTIETVAGTISNGTRIPWVNEPKCVTCHNTGVAEVDSGAILYRNASGHGGVFCAGCHGSPHAMTPSNQDSDNYQSLQYQGKAMAIGDCRVCHRTSRGAGSAEEFAKEHGSNGKKSACSVCHTGFQNASNTANWPHQFQWKSR